MTYHNEEKKVDIVALPTDDYRITVMVDYNNPALGSQHTGLFNLEKEFVTEFAPCRTFCFLHEVEMLHSQGLIRGGNLDNAIVIVDRELSDTEIKRICDKLGISEAVILGSNGVVNNRPLHFPNEPARHKLLDLMGDLALIGVPLKAQILAARPGSCQQHRVRPDDPEALPAEEADPQVPARAERRGRLRHQCDQEDPSPSLSVPARSTRSSISRSTRRSWA